MNDQHRGPPEGASPGPARAMFERSVAGIDVATANRLRLLRRAALARSAPRTARRRPALAAGIAAAAVVVLGLAWWLPPMAGSPAEAPALVAGSDLPLPADDDAELYAWLGEAPVATDGPQDGAL